MMGSMKNDELITRSSFQVLLLYYRHSAFTGLGIKNANASDKTIDKIGQRYPNLGLFKMMLGIKLWEV